jgi:pyruvate,orthophosphate dikinase
MQVEPHAPPGMVSMPTSSTRTTRPRTPSPPVVVALGDSGFFDDFDESECVGLLGGKGANLQRLARAGLPVPPGFIITTTARSSRPRSLHHAIDRELSRLEQLARRRIGDPRRPLSLILRCSMPPGVNSPSPAMRDVVATASTRKEARDVLVQRWHELRHTGPRLAVILQVLVNGEVRRGYTRHPETGEDRLVLDNDAVAAPALGEIKRALERCFRDMQEFEFVVDDGKPLLLGTRTPSRTTLAAVRIAADFCRRGLIDRETAVLRVDPAGVERLMHARFAPPATARPLTTGIGASPGAAVGRLAFSAEEAAERARAGEAVLLVRTETEPADIPAIKLCAGVLTSSGGMTSHAAVVARGWGKCCVVGAAELRIDARARRLFIGSRSFGADDVLSIDGVSGQVFAGALPVVAPRPNRDLVKILRFADEFRTLRVLANVDTPDDARVARQLGAEGIGLCRTEHMFFAPDRILAMREMILANTVEGRRAALAKMLPFQRDDFVGLFEAMHGLPVTLRLLDPPLHEFLPERESELRTLARSLGLSLSTLRRRVEQLRETNPMLGHRGDRLAVTYPEVLEMQVRAIIEAACFCRRRRIKVRPAIMVPLVGTRGELEFCKRLADATAEKVMREQRLTVPYRFGTMIEVPRAALVADELAESADFFSFGTNDLTQLTFGYSRDDCGGFLPTYLDSGILAQDPFQRLDERGVGTLVKLAVERGRGARPELQCGLCGEHGGDPRSVAFCHDAVLDYVSCSPLRVPVARLAAAHAALRSRVRSRQP